MTLKAWCVALGFCGLSIACGSDSGATKPSKNQFGGSGGSTSGGGAGNGGFVGTGSQTGTGNVFNGTGGVGSSGDAGPTCGSGVYQAESMPVDAYVMFDQSTSMLNTLPNSTQTWWQVAIAAFQGILTDPRLQNLGLGIQYFGLNGIAPDSCTIAQYATPEVEIAPLSTNAAAISSSLGNHSPISFTPTEPALQGALDHMTAWAPAHLGRAPAVILVTDGFPSECNLENTADGGLSTTPQISDIANRAKTAYDGPYKIRTFVIGFENGLGLSNLAQIAQAGGTKAPFLISATTGDIGTQFANAMLSISNTTLQCQFPLPAPPPGQTLDPYSVRVYYTPNATQTEVEIPWLSNGALCGTQGDNGWYYDAADPTMATQILVCPGTCQSFAAGTVRIGAGCQDGTPIN